MRDIQSGDLASIPGFSAHGWGIGRALALIQCAAVIGALPKPDSLEGMSWEQACGKQLYLAWVPKVAVTIALCGLVTLPPWLQPWWSCGPVRAPLLTVDTD